MHTGSRFPTCPERCWSLVGGKGGLGHHGEIGPLNCLYMPRASYNDTCPVFLRPSQSIPTGTSVYLAITLPRELYYAATVFVQDRPRCRWQRSLNIHYNLFLLFFFSFPFLSALAGPQNIADWNKISHPFGRRSDISPFLIIFDYERVLTFFSVYL